MRKTSILLLICTLALLLSFQHVFAEEKVPILDSATIDITIDNDIYKVKEEVVVKDLDGNQITHDVKEITENKVTQVLFTDDEGELTPEIDEGETLHKYTIQPNSATDAEVRYTIEYEVEKKEDIFEIPLFVPEYATSGDDRDVHITFQAPEGTIIQKNSFPIVNDAGQNQVEKDMTNMPAIAKYVYAENPTAIHSFSVISFIAIFSILLILLGWAIVEKKKGGRK